MASTENKSGGDDARRLKGINSSFFVMGLILRLLAIGATFSAAIVMGTNKQTVILPFVGPWPAKYQYLPALVYVGSRILDISVIFSVVFVNIDGLKKFFVVANAVACGYTLFSLIFSVTGKFASSTLSAFLLAVTDLVMVALVSAGVSAATAIAYVGYKGNSHTQWGKLCGIYGRFCHHGVGALVVSFVSVIIFMALSVMSIYSLYRRTSSAR